MKITYRDIDSFVKSPKKSARVILVYGPDNGLVRERANMMGKSVVADLNDPFNAVTMTGDSLSEDPARLSDEAGALSMMGGDRLIRIEGAGDKLTVLVKEYLTNPSEHSLVILQAGELGPRSSLRKLCEKENNAAAIPCYVEDERDVSRLIRETLHAEGHQIEMNAMSWLASSIAGDRGRVRSELEKLILYKGNDKSQISMADVRASCGGAGEQEFDDLIYQVAGRNAAAALKAYTILSEEGVAFIAILRSLQNHFRRLHLANSYIQDGLDAESAMKKLSPPVFFKKAPAFRNQMQSWPITSLNHVLAKLSELEVQCKQTGKPVDTLCSHAILAISKSRAR